MVYLIYPLMAVCLFWGAKICKRKEWNEDVLSYAQTKSFLGFAALMIILHHCSQRTSAPWLPVNRQVRGLDGFVYIGYIFVAMFFFCSGYGMYTSSRSKVGFFKGYYKRILMLLVPTVVMWLVFFTIERVKGMHIYPPVWLNTYDYIWFVPALIFMYIFFYLSFHLIKNEKAGVALMIAGTIIYFILCYYFSPGTWWYNTHHLFVVGIIVGRHKEGIMSGVKKLYPLWIVLSLIITAAFFYISNYYWQFITLIGKTYDDSTHRTVELLGQVISAFSATFLVFLIGMKIKIGNRLLKLLGAFTLEIYLVHPLFVQLFSFAFLQNTVKPLYHIQDPFLYVAAVMAVSVPIAFLLHKVIKKVGL